MFVFDLFVQRAIIEHFTNASRPKPGFWVVMALNHFHKKRKGKKREKYHGFLLSGPVALSCLERSFVPETHSQHSLCLCSQPTIVLLCSTMFSLASVKALKHVFGSTNQLRVRAPYTRFSERYSCTKKSAMFFPFLTQHKGAQAEAIISINCSTDF